MNEFLEQFLLESRELVAQAESDLLVLERQPDDRSTLDSAFRAFHTLKGGAGIVDFAAMVSTLHAAEDVLAEVRSGKRAMTTQIVSACLKILDRVAAWLDEIEATGDLPADGGARSGIDELQAGGELEETPPAPGIREETPNHGIESAASHAVLPAAARELIEAQIGLLRETSTANSAGRLGSAGTVVANVLRSLGRASAAGKVGEATREASSANDPLRLLSVITGLLRTPPNGDRAPAAAAVAPAASRTLRIDAERVDRLVNLTGELVVLKNSVTHIARLAQTSDPAVAARIKQIHATLESLLAELQRSVLGMRVLPLSHVFDRFPRLLRELGVTAKKPVQLLVEGGETEADKVVVESLFEPLLHVLRNAVDHGVEDADLRRARGKREMATVTLSARRVADRVVVEVRDDGGGIDLERVKAVALERNLIDEETLRTMNDDRVMDMIFEPGFSTAQSVNVVSGRGVGMDAVRMAASRLGGMVSIASEAGLGTTVRFELPFSVMMTSIMVVKAGGQAFGLPIDAVVETLRVEAGEIVSIGQARATVLRGRTLPVLSLAQALELSVSARSEAILVVTRGPASLGGILVEGVGERMEVMLKPLEGLLVGMRGIAGSTLLGDGSVLLVLDLAELLA